MAAKPLTLLEQWLEGVPNSNHQEADVKREKREFVPSSSSSSAFDPVTYFARHSFPAVPPTHPPAPPPPVRSPCSCNIVPILRYDRRQVVPETKVKTESQAIDTKSEEGVFGWAAVGAVHVPVIYRGTEGLVPVRIVESKVRWCACASVSNVVFVATDY